MKRIYVCSRYAGDTAKNVAVAARLYRKVIEAGHAPFAPHLIYTRLLDDRNPSERERGTVSGLTFMAVCNEVWVHTADGASNGMGRELDQAFQLGRPVVEIKEV